jgi:hypothetical protein
MCNICEDNGYTIEYERFTVIEGHSPQNDYVWRKRKCLCDSGDVWYNHAYQVDWAMAIRCNRFIDEYHGSVQSRFSTKPASMRELSVEYISEGRREYHLEGGGQYE